MKRVIEVKPAGEWAAGSASDRVVLDAGDRNRRRIVMTGEKGTEFLLDVEKPVSLRDGDGLALDDGSIVLVEDMLRRLGATLVAVDAAFDPESPTPSHEHDHAHHHGHSHGG